MWTRLKFHCHLFSRAEGIPMSDVNHLERNWEGYLIMQRFWNVQILFCPISSSTQMFVLTTRCLQLSFASKSWGRGGSSSVVSREWLDCQQGRPEEGTYALGEEQNWKTKYCWHKELVAGSNWPNGQKQPVNGKENQVRKLLVLLLLLLLLEFYWSN